MGVEKEGGTSQKLSEHGKGLAWRVNNVFIQKAFLKCLLCAKHRRYCSDLETPDLYTCTLLRGGVWGWGGEHISLTMTFRALRGVCADPSSIMQRQA